MTFWVKNGSGFKIEAGPYFKFLEDSGFCRYRMSNDQKPFLIQITNHIVKKATFEDIREYSWNYILSYKFQDEDSLKALQEEFIRTKVIQDRNILLIQERKDIMFLRDTKEKAYLFFKNVCIEITRSSVREVKYSELSGFIWEDQIRPYEYTGINNVNNLRGNYYNFLKDIAPNPPNGHDQASNFNSLRSILGYLMHNFKDEANAKAVIFYDSIVDGKSNGGTGKGLLLKGVQKIVETVVEDGKNLKQNNQFSFSQVRESTRVLVVDDAKEGFDFEKLFSPITENLTVERKFEHKYSIPFKLSPKIALTSNYIIPGEGSSHRRRRIEYALSEVYTDESRPDVKYGQVFFEDWNKEEWQDFFNLMIRCIQYFLEKGILMPIYNLKLRQLRQEASNDFIEFINGHIEPATRYNKTEIYSMFFKIYPQHFTVNKNTFTRWIKLAAGAFGYKYTDGHSGSDDYFELNL